MRASDFDLVIIGAGSGGLTAAGFAARLGARVALVEKDRIGGDCTWHGCVPSKALLRAAKAAHEVRTAARFGIVVGPPGVDLSVVDLSVVDLSVVDLSKVRASLREAITRVYHFESPEELRSQGVEIIEGEARFLDARTIQVGHTVLRAKTFLLATGARPRIPAIAGLAEIPFHTYQSIFDNDRLPASMIVVGGGPIGMEIAQAYRRFGVQVTIVAAQLLPKDEPEVSETMARVFEREGIHWIRGCVRAVRKESGAVVAVSDSGEARGEMLFIGSGRAPVVDALDPGKAGVKFSERGIPVDSRFRTNVKHIYAAGDVTGGPQFTHLAGWQAFQAARNALLPGSSDGLSPLPSATFTDPEVAHVGLSEQTARARFGDRIQVGRQDMSRTDRAICDAAEDGFVKIVAAPNGRILGATIVHSRAGEAICELALAIKMKMKTSDLAGVIHPYPGYSSATWQLAGDMTLERLLSGVSGSIVRGLSKLVR